MPLELESLKKAVAALAGVLDKTEDAAFMRSLDAVARNAIRSGAIQHFEFTYELCWKFVKRWLEMNVGPNAGDGVARRELFRMAAENLLIDDVEQWMRYHEARNQTSHTYQHEVAERVYLVANQFVIDADRLLRALEARND